jgi:hypothetical protein
MPDQRTVYIVCNCEVYAKKSSALALARKCIEDGLRHLKGDRARILKLLLAEDVELALRYWNDHCADDAKGGTAARVDFREAVVRED